MPRTPKHQTSIRMSMGAKRLVIDLAAQLGLSKSAVIELAIRRLAKVEGVK